MGGKMSRNKGQRGEREVAALLQPVVDKVYKAHGMEAVKMKRNLMQTQDGGYDLVGVDWLALEVKFQETFNITGWWKQTLEQTKPDQVSVLIYRRSRIPWRVRMNGFLASGDKQIKCPVDVRLESFLLYFEHRLDFALRTGGSPNG